MDEARKARTLAQELRGGTRGVIPIDMRELVATLLDTFAGNVEKIVSSQSRNQPARADQTSASRPVRRLRISSS
jgi:hypothetical protein